MRQRPACPNGHAAVVRGDNFCWSCGAAITMEGYTVCDCGQELAGAEYYCPKCGKRVKTT